MSTFPIWKAEISTKYHKKRAPAGIPLMVRPPIPGDEVFLANLSEVRAGCVFGAGLPSFCGLGCALTRVCGLSGVSPVQRKKKINHWCKRWRAFLFLCQGWQRKNRVEGGYPDKDEISARDGLCAAQEQRGAFCCGASHSDGQRGTAWVLHSPDGHETKIHVDWCWIIIL